MEQPQNQPIYWDKHRIPINLTVIFALFVALYGLYSWYTGAGALLLIAGLAVGAYSWFTNPRQYWIYPDALVIVYGKPRTRVVSFTNLSHLEMRGQSAPDRLRALLHRGRQVVLLVRDPDAFNEQLQKALDDYRGQHTELGIGDSSSDDAPQVQDPPDQPPFLFLNLRRPSERVPENQPFLVRRLITKVNRPVHPEPVEGRSSRKEKRFK